MLQDDLEALLERLDASLAWLSKKSSGHPNELKAGLTRCQSQLDEGRGFLSEMEREARGAPLQYRTEMISKVRTYRQAIGQIQSDIRKKELEMNKDKLLGHYEGEAREEEQSIEDQLRQQVLRGAAVLDKTSESIQRSTQVAAESEEIGGEIMTNLHGQRETLERARAMISETDAELSRSRRILKRLSRSTIYNKVVLVIIIIIQLFIIGALVYWKWFSK